MSIARFAAVSLLLSAGTLAGGPALTTIQDTLYTADGARLTATAVITWRSFESSDTSAVAMQTLTVQVVNGSIYVQLVPNTTANPSLPYTVTYTSDGMIQFQETWMIPPSLSPLRVRDVRTSSTTNIGSGSGGSLSGGGASSGPITESGVTGLIDDLAARPLKGPGYGAGRVAIVDQNGAVNTVAGSFNDCVYVNGTSGPCFDSTQLPTYSDGETPAGVVDGANTNFGIAVQPSPAQSLMLFRNGMAQKQGFDYTLTGSTVKFAAGVAPQPGDTLIAWYRTPSVQGAALLGALNQGPVLNTVSPQVVCSATGSQTSATALASLGTCTIPANILGPGDRVEIRFLFLHNGTSTAFTYAVLWGGTTVIQRAGAANDVMIAGRADAGITTGLTQIAGESYGTVLPLLTAFITSADSNAAPIAINFKAAGPDPIGLANYTVIRYPAIGNP